MNVDRYDSDVGCNLMQHMKAMNVGDACISLRVEDFLDKVIDVVDEQGLRYCCTVPQFELD